MPTNRSLIREAWDNARARQDHTFTVSVPCARGHTSGVRYASNGACVDCIKASNSNRFNPKARKKRLAEADGKLVQLKQDKSTAALGQVVGKRIQELTGQAVSHSIIYRAAIAVLAAQLSENISAANVRALIR